MNTPRWIDNKLSIGNIITIMVVAGGVMAGWYAKDTAIARNTSSIESLQKDMSRVVQRIDNIESYQDNTIDRLARIEEQTQAMNDSLNRLISKLDTLYRQ